VVEHAKSLQEFVAEPLHESVRWLADSMAQVKKCASYVATVGQVFATSAVSDPEYMDECVEQTHALSHRLHWCAISCGPYMHGMGTMGSGRCAPPVCRSPCNAGRAPRSLRMLGHLENAESLPMDHRLHMCAAELLLVTSRME